MKLTWRDIVSSTFAVIGLVVVFAKIQSYSWWLIGSWKGALVVIGVIGLGILLTNIQELVKVFNGYTLTQIILWVIAATVVVGSLFVATTSLEFYVAAALIGLAWLTQMMDHVLVTSRSHGHWPHTMSA